MLYMRVPGNEPDQMAKEVEAWPNGQEGTRAHRLRMVLEPQGRWQLGQITMGGRMRERRERGTMIRQLLSVIDLDDGIGWVDATALMADWLKAFQTKTGAAESPACHCGAGAHCSILRPPTMF
jgi:hypothetical protein